MKTAAAGGKVATKQEWGGLFQPVPGKQQRPVYSVGPANASVKDLILFQCPVSAIPDWIWELLLAWWNSRLMRTLPAAGGFLDQPVLVRRAFPVFEQEMQAWERSQQGTGGMAMAAGVAAAVSGRK